MIYPEFKAPFVVGVTAPSSGVAGFEETLEKAIEKIKTKAMRVIVDATTWEQDKVRSTSAVKRARELNDMLQSTDINLIFPPWGGELAIEVLDKIDYQAIKPKWFLGYSDISLLTFAITVTTGIATAHGPNLVDQRFSQEDTTTAAWSKVLETKQGMKSSQIQSDFYQKDWDYDADSFKLTEPTSWQTIGKVPDVLEGRLLGGCIDVIRHTIGTSYGDVRKFQDETLSGEPILWYLENCELNPVDLKRTLKQMHLAGWFDNISGILFGRTSVTNENNGYTITNVYQEMASELDKPVIYDIDCGHVPPQMTFVNGASGRVYKGKSKWRFDQFFD